MTLLPIGTTSRASSLLERPARADFPTEKAAHEPPRYDLSQTVLRSIAQRLLEPADIRIDGKRPWDIRIHDPNVIRQSMLKGSIGFGEAYLDGGWSCDDLEELSCRLAASHLEEVAAWHPMGVFHRLRSMAQNQQTRNRATRVAREHYDFSNDFFASFLGRYMSYSCGYYRDTDDLDEAQRLKLDLLCRKLALRPGEHLLDVGGGWGAFARHAASNYGVRVTSVNISEEQMAFARQQCRGLDVEIVRSDYRDIRGTFDKVAAIAMFTHVGYRNYRTFMESMARVVKPGGLFIMEGIWNNVSMTNVDAWVDKYIFPGGMLPSGAQTFEACEGLFVIEDLHNFGADYTKTLRAWYKNLQAAWPRIGSQYGERVRRIFEFYFLVCAGYFRARAIQNWQLVLSAPGRAPSAFRLS